MPAPGTLDRWLGTGAVTARNNQFVIYVQLFLSSLVCAGSAITFATGYLYTAADSSSELVYAFYPEMQAIDICVTIVYAVLAVFAIVVRFQLSGFKRNAWQSYLVYLAAVTVTALGYIIAVGVVYGQPLVDSESISSFVANIVLIIVSYVYFSKRDHLFVN